MCDKPSDIPPLLRQSGSFDLLRRALDDIENGQNHVSVISPRFCPYSDSMDGESHSLSPSKAQRTPFSDNNTDFVIQCIEYDDNVYPPKVDPMRSDLDVSHKHNDQRLDYVPIENCVSTEEILEAAAAPVRTNTLIVPHPQCGTPPLSLSGPNNNSPPGGQKTQRRSIKSAASYTYVDRIKSLHRRKSHLRSGKSMDDEYNHSDTDSDIVEAPLSHKLYSAVDQRRLDDILNGDPKSRALFNAIGRIHDEHDRKIRFLDEAHVEEMNKINEENRLWLAAIHQAYLLKMDESAKRLDERFQRNGRRSLKMTALVLFIGFLSYVLSIVLDLTVFSKNKCV